MNFSFPKSQDLIPSNADCRFLYPKKPDKPGKQGKQGDPIDFLALKIS